MGYNAGKSGISAPREETARYIAEVTAELQQLASSAGLGLVAYLLAMASEDAAAAAKQFER